MTNGKQERPGAPRRRAWWAAAAATLAGTAAGAAALLLWRRQATRAEAGHLPVARHEERDIGFRPMAVAAGLTLAGLAGMAGLALWIYPDTPTDKSLPNPLPAFPQPVLQDNVGADYAALHGAQLRQLNGAFWLDRDRNVVHVPIAQAMEDVARDGIADWPAASRERRK